MFKKLKLRLSGDWFSADQYDADKTWGVYHPWRVHDWGYGLTQAEAQSRVDRYNQALLNGEDVYALTNPQSSAILNP